MLDEGLLYGDPGGPHQQEEGVQEEAHHHPPDQTHLETRTQVRYYKTEADEALLNKVH